MMLSKKVYLAFDGRMAQHRPISASQTDSMPSLDEENEEEQEVHCEIPDRIHAIYDRLQELEPEIGSNRFIDVQCKPASRNTIELVHSAKHYEFLARTERMSLKELQQITIPNDLYFCNQTFLAAKLAAGGVVECVNAVTDNCRKSTRAIAIVRPPGHHAGRNEAMGKYWSFSLLECQ